MDKKRKNLLEMRKLGFSQKTLSLMTESQVEMILERIKRKETKEAATVQTTTKKVVPPGNDISKEDLDGANEVKSTDKGTEITKQEETTEGKKKKKKYNPWAVCTASVGRKNKKKYEDCVMGVKKKLKEGRNPYEYLIESKMEEIVENNLSPKMTKGELLRIIAEKKMMMKKPIGKMMSMEGDTKTAPSREKQKEKTTTPKRTSNPGKNPSQAPAPAKASWMEGDTKTAPSREKQKEKTTTPKRTSNPGKNPGTAPAPAKAEQEKGRIIDAIFNLIDKESK
jgi:hypothetical protein